MAANDTIIKSIRVALAARGENQAALAKRLGVSRAWVTDRMVGRTKLTTDDLDQIASAVNVRLSDLTSGALIPALLANSATALAAEEVSAK